MEDGTFVRDEEGEEAVQKLIYESARGPEPDGDDNEFQDFLNDFGEGLESEQIRRDNEVSIYVSISLCSSLDAFIYMYCTY